MALGAIVCPILFPAHHTLRLFALAARMTHLRTADKDKGKGADAERAAPGDGEGEEAEARPEEVRRALAAAEDEEEAQVVDTFGTLAVRDDGAATFYGRSAGSEVSLPFLNAKREKGSSLVGSELRLLLRPRCALEIRSKIRHGTQSPTQVGGLLIILHPSTLSGGLTRSISRKIPHSLPNKMVCKGEETRPGTGLSMHIILPGRMISFAVTVTKQVHGH